MFIKIWLCLTVIIPMVVVFLLLGETNFSNQNYIIPSHSQTPPLTLPANKSGLSQHWNAWIKQIPNELQSCFFQYQNGQIGQLKIGYENDQLKINGIFFPKGTTIAFHYCQKLISIFPLWVCLVILGGQIIFLISYFCFQKSNPACQWSTSELWAIISGFWTSGLVLIYSAAIPPIGHHESPYVWYLLLVRFLLIILSGLIVFAFQFQIAQWLQKRFNSFRYHQKIIQNYQKKQ